MAGFEFNESTFSVARIPYIGAIVLQVLFLVAFGNIYHFIIRIMIVKFNHYTILYFNCIIICLICFPHYTFLR